ncbi:hypothetical protein [Aureimonas sp. AU40]|uniref:hypothetical protein n=1 Tax=Aureimonas sp. AU40 TaxID=1637747 RepID=UPI000AB0CB71|nr:hypothetical protein [Aureimonas sp. AU40]
MSNIPIEPGAEPDLAAEELAGKHNIPIDEAKRIVAEQGTDRATIDGAAERAKDKPE